MTFYLRANFSHMSPDVFECHVPCMAQVGGEGGIFHPPTLGAAAEAKCARPETARPQDCSKKERDHSTQRHGGHTPSRQ